jgi:hypothetical protein
MDPRRPFETSLSSSNSAQSHSFSTLINTFVSVFASSDLRQFDRALHPLKLFPMGKIQRYSHLLEYYTKKDIRKIC